MLACKFLDAGRSRFTGFRWPLPSAGEPGDWVDVTGPLELCVNGVHACTPAQLPPWLGPELWWIELAGDVVDKEVAVLASRARLVGRVDVWDEDAHTAFAVDCAARARGREAKPDLSALVDVVERCAGTGHAAAAGYWSAVLAGQQAAGKRAGAEYDRAFAAERDEQARWLGARMRLSGSG